MALGGTLTQCPAWCRNKTRDGASDCTDKRSSAGRGVPSYRVLVLVACLSNPLFGIAVYLLNKAAVRNFRDGAKEKAQRLYLATFIVGAASVVVTVTSVVEVIVWAALTPDLQGPHCGVAGKMIEAAKQTNRSVQDLCRTRKKARIPKEYSDELEKRKNG